MVSPPILANIYLTNENIDINEEVILLVHFNQISFYYTQFSIQKCF